MHTAYDKFTKYFEKNQAGFLGAQIHVLDLDAVTGELQGEGVEPVWKWKQFGSSILKFTNTRRQKH